MSLDELVGSTYGPFPTRITAERVAAYVAATGDDAGRWVKHAPPSFAGALLFVAAPSFLHAPGVKPYTKLLVHADQVFAWNRALEIDETVVVTGELARVRTRGAASFVTFESSVRSGDEEVISAKSTFVMGAGEPETVFASESEPPVEERGALDPVPAMVEPDGDLPPMRRSASRLDLVRYAAASGDFNPVHFDHDTARQAGFGGVLVHGLLMGAWVVQYAAALSSDDDAVASAKLRFRNALRPAVGVKVSGRVTESAGSGATLRVSVDDHETEYVRGVIELNTK